MAKKMKHMDVPKGRNWFYALVRPFMPFIFKKPETINLAGEIPDKHIVVVNHSAKSGPAALNIRYPKTTCKWGAYQMFGNFQSRKAYLRDILYIQKCHMPPGRKTSFKAWLLGHLNPGIYKGMRMMPTYPDARFTNTLRQSCKVLDANLGVMIFPENSNDGYHEVLTEFFPGFVMLAEKYYRAKGEDVPVIPAYYHVKKRVQIIGKPMYVQDYVKQGMNREEIAKVFCDAVNQLFYDYVQDYVTPTKAERKAKAKAAKKAAKAAKKAK